MANEQAAWQPDWAVPPGEILAEALKERGMSQSELARRMDRPVKTINEIVNGKAAITPDTAIQLEHAIGISARLWNGLETQYREHLALERAERELESLVDWAKDFPIRDLVRYGLIPEGRSRSKGGRVGALLSFFGVSNSSAWERQWLAPAASFRESPTFSAAPKAVAAWLRWGEIQAGTVAAASYDAKAFRHAVDEFRSLTRGDPLLIIDRIKDLAAASGVVLVLTPELRGTHLSGAARWLTADRALIQLSLRHKTDDQFWFSLFHEAGHILEADRRNYVDSSQPGDKTSSKFERAADTFARDILIPPEAYGTLVSAGDFSESAIRTFANAQDVAPGIVLGRLQRDRRVSAYHFNNLKKPITWGAPA
ncbi:MAG: HigA family addiction module antitoxin [Acidimicrobiales bacterium]|jgi:addiction module HigA family antidote